MLRLGLWGVVLLAGVAAVLSFRARVADGGTPGWDSASHGVQGVALAQDLQRLDVANFAADAFGHRYRYPPGHPTILAVAYLVFGSSWWTAIGVSAVLFAALAVLLFATADSPAAGWIAALLALTSPALLALSGMIMLEIPAAILMALALRLYARSLEDDSAVRPLGWTLTVFMLTAAQYAACAIAILVLFEAWRSRVLLREVVTRFVRSRALFHPLHLLIAAAILVAVVVHVTGGWKIGRLSMTRAGGPLIAAALLLGLRVGWVVWTRRAHVREFVPRRYRDIFLTGVVPIYVWVFVLYPPRFQQFAEWISRPPAVHARTDPAHWTFYPEHFLNEGHAAVAISVFVVLLAASSFFRPRSERIQFLQWAVLAGTALVLIHHSRQSRFLVPFLVAWWMLAAETLAGLKIRRIATIAATAALAVAAVRVYGRDEGSPPPIHREYARVLNWTVHHLDDPPSWRVIGGVDGLSRHLFEWELRQRHDLRKKRLGFNLDLPEDWETDPEGPRKIYDAWMRGDPESIVVAIEPIDLRDRAPRSVEEVRKSDHDWPEFTMRFLWTETRYEVASEGDFPEARVRVRIYRRKS